MLMSVLSTTSFIRAIAVTERVPSLTESSALCECASMMPGVTYIPVASMTLAFAPAWTSLFLPTAAILPSRIRIEPFSITPCEAVMIVAFLIRTSPLFCACATTANEVRSAANRIAVYLFIVISSENVGRTVSSPGFPLRANCEDTLPWCARAAESRVLSHCVQRAANRIAVNCAFSADGNLLILNLRSESEGQFIAVERAAEREGSERRRDFSADRRALLLEIEGQLNRPLLRF